MGNEIRTVIEIAEIAAKLGTIVAEAVKAAIAAGDASTIESLRAVCRTPEEYALLDEALIAVQRAKHTAGLPEK